eukprot:2708639-Amphidinium_carterae.1
MTSYHDGGGQVDLQKALLNLRAESSSLSAAIATNSQHVANELVTEACENTTKGLQPAEPITDKHRESIQNTLALAQLVAEEFDTCSHVCEKC